VTELGLDAAFLDFIREPDPEVHRRIHGFYVPFFEGCDMVVDLACGEGVFVRLLVEAGREALGVDADPDCVARARAAEVPVVEADVLAWLSAQPDGSADGLFNAHLVEHLPYPAVLELFRQAHRVLAPGGVLLTVTPNVRGLYGHLEMFYQHFGHETFYHPRLLRFLAHRAGFECVEEGENPRLAAPLFGSGDDPAPPPLLDLAGVSVPLPRYTPELPRPGGALGGLWWRLKTALARLLVRPYVDPVVADLHAAMAAANVDRVRLAAAIDRVDTRAAATQARLTAVLDRLDRSFEAYVVCRKDDR